MGLGRHAHTICPAEHSLMECCRSGFASPRDGMSPSITPSHLHAQHDVVPKCVEQRACMKLLFLHGARVVTYETSFVLANC